MTKFSPVHRCLAFALAMALSLTSAAQAGNTPPIVNNEANTVLEDGSVSGSILTGDSDPDGTTLTANTNLVKSPSHGTIFLGTNGNYSYIPVSDFYGNDTIIISVCDAGLPLPAICVSDTLVITVLPVNDGPIISNDANITIASTPVNGNIITGADSDPEGTALSANTALVRGPSHGTLFLNTSGAYTYIPSASYIGSDTIVISVCDAGIPLPGLCANDTLVITVIRGNTPPIIANDSNTTRANTAVNGNIITAADSDPDGTILTANTALVTAPAHGTIFVSTTGAYTYIPVANYTGGDTIVISVCDSGTPLPAICKNDTLFISVRNQNTKPVAADDSTTTAEDTAVSGTVAANDSDTDGPTAIYSLSGRPAHGAATLSITGAFTYTPAADYNGNDTFTYILCDGGTPNLCDTASVYITVTAVNDAPVANADTSTTNQNIPTTGSLATNDADVDGPRAIYTVVTAASHGTFALDSSGSYSYVPAQGYTGCDTMTVSLCDGGSPNLCDTSLVSICTIIATTNNAPTALNDSAGTTQNGSINIPVLANDSDADSNLVFTPVVVATPAHGTATVNANSTITYTPDSGFAGIDSFSYAVCDAGTPALCDTAFVFVTVATATSGTVFSAVPMVTKTDSATTTCIPYTVSAGSAVTASLTCSPAHGRVVITIDSADSEACLTYIPDTAYHGLDTFCVTVCDVATASCATATIPVTVNSLNHNCYWLKGISPNGNNENETFYVNCNDNYPNSTLKVFNRWGDQVWDSQGHYTNNFGGENGRGDVLSDGTYFYIYEFNDGSHDKHAGFIQISR